MKVDILSKTKKQALEYCSVGSMPKMISPNEEYNTRAIILVKKAFGESAYCIGKWNLVEKKTAIIKDFFPQGGGVKEIISVYPLVEKASEETVISDEEYSVEDIRKLMDDANIPYPNNKKNDKKWLLAKYKSVMTERRLL